MKPSRPLVSNFAPLGEQDDQFLRIGMLAERYFGEAPNTCLLKLRQLAEVLDQATAAHVELFLNRDELRYMPPPADVKGPAYTSETFLVLKEKEIRHHGEYRTRHLVLEA